MKIIGLAKLMHGHVSGGRGGEMGNDEIDPRGSFKKSLANKRHHRVDLRWILPISSNTYDYGELYHTAAAPSLKARWIC